MTTIAVYTAFYPTTDVTATSTVTYISAASTTYAACATNNLVDHANGDNGIVLGGYTDQSTQLVTVDNINDSYDCCVACQTYAGDCGGFTFAPGYCSVTIFNTCNPDNFGSYFESSSQDANGTVGFVVGNGPCGQVANDGNF